MRWRTTWPREWRDAQKGNSIGFSPLILRWMILCSKAKSILFFRPTRHKSWILYLASLTQLSLDRLVRMFRECLRCHALRLSPIHHLPSPFTVRRRLKKRPRVLNGRLVNRQCFKWSIRQAYSTYIHTSGISPKATRHNQHANWLSKTTQPNNSLQKQARQQKTKRKITQRHWRIFALINDQRKWDCTS